MVGDRNFADDILFEGPIIPFDPGIRHADCLGDIDEAKKTFAALDLDFLAIDLTDPAIGFPVVQVVVPGYSDVLPYHAPSSPALFRAITRSEVLDSYPVADLY